MKNPVFSLIAPLRCLSQARSKPSLHVLWAVLLSLLLFGTGRPAHAAAVSWDGGAGTANWADNLNWSNDLAPTVADDLTFNALTAAVTAAGGVVTVPATATCKSITFTVTGWTLSGGTITFPAAGAITTATGMSAIVNSVIAGAATSLTLAGGTTATPGPLTLGGANTFSGAVTISGTLNVSSINSTVGSANRTATSNLGAPASGKDLIQWGGTLNYTGSETSDRALQLNASPSALNCNGNPTFTGNFNINTRGLNLGGTGGNATLAGVISASATPQNVSQTSTTTWNLTGNNTYTGQTSGGGGGFLQIGDGGNSGSIQSSAITGRIRFNRNTNSIYAGGIFGNTSAIEKTGAGDLTLSGNYSGNFATLTKNGAGNLTLTGTANTFGSSTTSTTTTLADGTLTVNGTSSGSVISVSGAGVLAGTGTVRTVGFGANTAAKIAPGDGGIGTLSVTTGTTAFSANSKFVVELGQGTGNATGNLNDLLAVTGTAALGSLGTLDASVVSGATTPRGSVYTVLTGTTNVSGTFSNAANAVTLTITDGRKYTVNYITGANGKVTLTAQNNVPVLTNPGARSVIVGDPALSFGLSATDDDTDTLTYSVVSVDGVPVGSVTNPPTISGSTFNWTPTLAQLGAKSIIVRATDTQSAFAEQTFTITVKGRPQISTPATQTMFERNSANNNTLTLSGANKIAVSDGDNANLSLTLNATGGIITLASTTGLTVGNDGSAAVTLSGPKANLNTALDGLVFTPTLDLNGTGSIQIVANDLDTPSTTSTVNINITAVNNQPYFDPIGNVSAEAGSAAQNFVLQNVSLGPANESGQAIFSPNGVSASSSLPAVAGVSVSGTTITVTPATTIGVSTLVTITVNLKDDGGTANGGVDTRTRTFTFTVNPSSANTNPSVAGGGIPDKNYNEDLTPATGDAASFSVASFFSDPDAGAFGTLSYSVDNNTNTGLLTAAISGSTLTLTLAANANGTAQVTVKATDGAGAFITSVFNVNVAAVNDTPSFAKGGDQTVNEDAGAQSVNPWATAISEGATNESTQVLTFTVTNNTNPSLFSVAPAISAGGVLTYTPAADANGTATITLTLSDDNGTPGTTADDATSGPQSFSITVNPVNDLPSFTKGADQTVAKNSGAASVPNWATAISAGPANESGQVLTFTVTNNTNPSLFSVAPAVAANGTLTFTPATNAVGSTTITLTLKDDNGTPAIPGDDLTTASQSFVITVSNNALINDFSVRVAGGSTDLDQDFAQNGDTIIIEGSGFKPTASNPVVKMKDDNGTDVAITVTSATDTEIRATISGTARTGNVTVITNGGSGTTTVSGTVFIVIPKFSATPFSPTSGAAGSVVTISGRSFGAYTNADIYSGVILVKFSAGNGSFINATPSNFTFDAGTGIETLQATIPAGAATGKVRLVYTRDDGSGLTQSNVESTLDFTVTTSTNPVITSFSPTNGPVGSKVKLFGLNFTGTTLVEFVPVSPSTGGTKTATFNLVSPTQINATVPSGLNVNGTYRLRVTNAAGSGNTSALDTPVFTYNLKPAIFSFSPTTANQGTRITISGANFTSTDQVFFSGPASTFIEVGFSVRSDTTLQATVPSGAITGKIRVVNNFGTTDSTTELIIAPQITSFTDGLNTPRTGPAGGVITITGKGFRSYVTKVKIGNISVGAKGTDLNDPNVGFVVVNDTTIQAKVTATAVSGTLTLVYRTAAATTAPTANVVSTDAYTVGAD